MPTFCYTREQRLTHKKQYDLVFNQTGFKFGTAHFLVLATFRNDGEAGRLGLVASKKHLKNAINRNRFKRQAREAFRLNQSLLAGCDIIVLSRPQSLQCESLVASLSEVWPRLERKRRKSQPAGDNTQTHGPQPAPS